MAAVDCGTTAIKAGIFDLAGRMRGFAARPCPCISRPDGRIENDPRLLVREVLRCLGESARSLGKARGGIAALAISTQRATVLALDDAGEALGRAISWQDMRGAGEIEALRRRIDDRRYARITGLPNHPVFTLAKLLWIQRHDRARARKTRRFALVQDYLLKALGAEEFFCDWSNASLTGMLDIGRFQWSRPILELAELDAARLPVLVPSGLPVGTLSAAAARACGLPEGLALIAGGGDQQCAGVGAGAVRPGVVEITLGTAAAPLCYSDKRRQDPQRRVTCCAHAVAGKWEIEGLQHVAGASLKWMRGIYDHQERFSPAFFRRLARVRPGAGGVLFYPYLDGAGAPHWDARARAAFLGLSLAHDRYALVRAVIEGVSMETREILEVFAALRVPVDEVRLTGGCAAIGVWNQIQADLYGKPVRTLENRQASLLGAAILAAQGVGLYRSVAEASDAMVRLRRTYTPAPARTEAYEEIYRTFCRVRREMGRTGLFGAHAPEARNG